MCNDLSRAYFKTGNVVRIPHAALFVFFKYFNGGLKIQNHDTYFRSCSMSHFMNYPRFILSFYT